MNELGAHYLSDVRERFVGLKSLADTALGQVDQDFFTVLGPEGNRLDNSLAVIVKHLSGNMRSRWGNSVTAKARLETATASLSCRSLEAS